MGINLNLPIEYVYSSLRQFSENEHHVKRICKENVLLLVFEGVLRFSEDGKEQEVRSGEYYIQHYNGFQDGIIASDKPRYLFVHFRAEWDENDDRLAYRGTYSFNNMKNLIFELDKLVFNKAPRFEKSVVFYNILYRLINPQEDNSLSNRIKKYIDKNYNKKIKLDDICNHLGFSRNYIINTLKKESGYTPNEYLIYTRIRHAKHMIETTSNSLESIAFECGFSDYSHFYRAFSKYVKSSPTIWREERRNLSFPSYNKRREPEKI